MIKRFYEATAGVRADWTQKIGPNVVKAAEEDMQVPSNFELLSDTPCGSGRTGFTTNKYKKNNYASFPQHPI